MTLRQIKAFILINSRKLSFSGFYNDLINDPELIGAMKENGYSGVLCMHPMHCEQCRDFNATRCLK